MNQAKKYGQNNDNLYFLLIKKKLLEQKNYISNLEEHKYFNCIWITTEISYCGKKIMTKCMLMNAEENKKKQEKNKK